MDGYQVAMLVPTTVLAQQHYNTFRERLAALPVARRDAVALPQRQRGSARSSQGGRDGQRRHPDRHAPHPAEGRRRSRQLGMVIIDEEQRFGVAHKERLKQMRQEVDVLTLSATPIPRTLHMSLAGIRDISNMTTPPEDRTPIRTYVTRVRRPDHPRGDQRASWSAAGRSSSCTTASTTSSWSAARIRKLMSRGGGRHRPRADGRAPAGEAMLDVLPRRDGRAGLHDDHRVGPRYPERQHDHHQPGRPSRPGAALPAAGPRRARPGARLRLPAVREEPARSRRRHSAGCRPIFEATELGAGFQIAMRDLEIRGAGNLLGAEQSGHMAAVGFDLYVRLLGEAVERLKAVQRGETPPPPTLTNPAVALDLPITAYLPDAYIPDLNMRLAVYQRLAQATTDAEVEAMEKELVDRFGPLPPPARNLDLDRQAASAGHDFGHRRHLDRGRVAGHPPAAGTRAGPQRPDAQARADQQRDRPHGAPGPHDAGRGLARRAREGHRGCRRRRSEGGVGEGSEGNRVYRGGNRRDCGHSNRDGDNSGRAADCAAGPNADAAHFALRDVAPRLESRGFARQRLL